MNRNAACNFNYRSETEGLLKVSGIVKYAASGNSSESVQDRGIITADHCLLLATFWAAVDKISTDGLTFVERRAVPLR